MLFCGHTSSHDVVAHTHIYCTVHTPYHTHISGGLAFFVWGASSKMAPLQIKHRYKVSEENGSLVNFPIFLLVLFDTLNWSRAGCIHLND